MKKILQIFKTWVLLITLFFGVLGANAQDTWYVFDDYLYDEQPVATFSGPDADGNYVTTFVPGMGESDTYVFTNSFYPSSNEWTTTFLGSATGNVPVSEPGTYDLQETDHDTIFEDVENVYRPGKS